jgi:hypothetical protein
LSRCDGFTGKKKIRYYFCEIGREWGSITMEIYPLGITGI